MLNLARYVGQTIIIGNDIRVVVVRIKRNQVCLGIEAPLDVSVHREEVYERIQDEKGLEVGINDDDGLQG